MELHTPKYVKVLQYVVMIIMALFMFFPIYWIFSNNFRAMNLSQVLRLFIVKVQSWKALILAL